MNPFSKPITFSEKKPNHFYCVKENNTYLKIDDPQIGDTVYEIATVSGGAGNTKRLLLEIPIPLCQKHQHDGIPFGVKTCNNWEYIVIPTPLGSLRCRECNDELFLPQPYLRSANLNSANLNSADLRSANLRSANLSYADLSSANLSSADLRSADLRSANLNSADLRSANLSYADLSSADLSYADLRSADLRSADLRSANLSSANLNSARNINESLHIDKAYWNKFTKIDEQFKKLLSKKRFVE
jgi:hypothetical protein